MGTGPVHLFSFLVAKAATTRGKTAAGGARATLSPSTAGGLPPKWAQLTAAHQAAGSTFSPVLLVPAVPRLSLGSRPSRRTAMLTVFTMMQSLLLMNNHGARFWPGGGSNDVLYDGGSDKVIFMNLPSEGVKATLSGRNRPIRGGTWGT